MQTLAGLPSWAPVLVTVSCSIVVPLLLFRFSMSAKHLTNEPPMLPYWIPRLGHLIPFFRMPDEFLSYGRSYFGSLKPFAIRLMGKTFYIISDPKDVAAIFKNTKTLTFVGFIEDVMINGWEAPREFVERIKLPSEGGELFYKDPSLFTNTHEWYHEFLVNGSNLSLLTSRMLDGLVDNMETKYKFPGLESLNRNNTVDLGLYTWMFHYLGTSMTNVLYGPAFMALCPDFMTILRDFDGMAWKIFYMYPKFLTTEAHSAKYYMLDAMERYYVAWSKSEAIQKDASDFFNKRIKMMYAANCTAREIAYHTLGVLFAAHTNSTKATTWTLLYILTTPGLASRIRSETSKAFPGDSSTRRVPSVSYLMNSCPLLMSVTSEVLRIVANPSSTRVVEEDTVVDGHLFRKGGMVMLPTSHLHSSPAWGDAAFDPDRFLNNPSLDKTSNGNYGPFGGGITYCPGRFLARQEIHMVVALMLDKYDMELVGGKASLPKKSTLKPTLGVFEPADTENIRVNVRRRA